METSAPLVSLKKKKSDQLNALTLVVRLKSCVPVEWIGQFHILPLEVTLTL